jgi:DNA-binding response OmpR family regulator
MEDINILVVEDEIKIANTLKSGLEEQGYKVTLAYNGSSGEKLLDQNDFNLAILDIMLPDINGYILSRNIRMKKNKIPILMLTALGSVDDKLEGFEAGADDYLVKPFAFKELLARIKSMLRRTAHEVRKDNLLRIADLELNPDNKEVYRAGKKIPLTVKEFQLLEFLIQNKNKVVSRSDIASRVWDIGFDTKTNVIDVYITFLRKKIDRDFPVKLIHTQFGMGYILKEEPVS